jgi:predicted nucleotidyltransferase
MLSVQPRRKICGRTASGRQITDDLISALARKAEAGYEIVELTEIREDVRRIASAHGAQNVRLFGSVRRGQQDVSSDLDLLVDMAEGRTLFDLIALSNDLEESLGMRVDVVTEASLSPYVRDRVLDEAIAL